MPRLSAEFRQDIRERFGNLPDSKVIINLAKVRNAITGLLDDLDEADIEVDAKEAEIARLTTERDYWKGQYNALANPDWFTSLYLAKGEDKP